MAIADRFDPRNNSINAVRLGLAVVVLLSHSLTLSGGQDPLGAFTGGDVDLGTVAVDGFFALSGFLIAGSYLNSPSGWRFLWRRCLRILPGFWVCLMVTAVVILPIAQLLAYGSMTGFPLVGDQSVVSYVVGNWALYIQQFQVRGLMLDKAVNGSLYTLFYEFACYLGVAVLGVFGLLRRHRWLVLVAAALVWAAMVLDLLTGGILTSDSVTTWLVLRLGGMFLAGVVAHVWADRIRLSWPFGAAAMAIVVLALAGAGIRGADPSSRMTYLVLAPPAVAYLVILVGASRRLPQVGQKRDLSYGVYVYAWPVQVLLLMVGGGDWPVAVYFMAALVVTGVAALASWTLIEAPALALKSWTPPSFPFSRSRRAARSKTQV